MKYDFCKKSYLKKHKLLILRLKLKWKEKVKKEFIDTSHSELIKLFSLCKRDNPVRYRIAK